MRDTPPRAADPTCPVCQVPKVRPRFIREPAKLTASASSAVPADVLQLRLNRHLARSQARLKVEGDLVAPLTRTAGSGNDSRFSFARRCHLTDR